MIGIWGEMNLSSPLVDRLGCGSVFVDHLNYDEYYAMCIFQIEWNLFENELEWRKTSRNKTNKMKAIMVEHLFREINVQVSKMTKNLFI